MYKCYQSWWLSVFVGITISCFKLPAQSSSSIRLVKAVEQPFFGSLELDTNKVQIKEAPFQVFSQYPKAETLAMLGQLKTEADRHYFTPRFPFRQGKTYWIKWQNKSGKEQISTVEIPIQQQVHAPTLTAIYPSADRWPANQLKFYLQFDQPMREGVALQYIQLLNHNGQEIKAPFLDMGQELWDKDQKQLTVWFDPGRIKTGLIPNEKHGPPLLEERRYQLNIKQGFPAKNGQTLQATVVKYFNTASKDQQRPNPSHWKMTLPKKNTRDTLILEFPESLDYGLLRSAIWVEEPSGEIMAGSLKIGPREKSWYWVPTKTWKAGLYTLKIDEDLEDLAGNNLQRLFDTFISKASKEEEPISSIEFRIDN